jgi:peptidoglycan/LPS O-acetylase OafA/YrhL
MKTIADIADAGHNSFGLVRLMAAIAVVISHAFVITGGPLALQPFEAMTGYPLGAHAVHVFFTVSGLLVAASFERRPKLLSFAAARFFRIYPGLVVAAVAIFLFAALFVSDAPLAEIVKGSIVGYFAKILVALAGSSAIPGVFETIPHQGVNVPLWTLKYEVLCYAGLGIGMAILIRFPLVKPLTLCWAVIGTSALWLLQGKAYNDAGFLDHIARFSFAFWSGAAAWHLRHRIPVSGAVLAVLFSATAAAIVLKLPVLPHALMLLSGYLALWFGQYRFGWLSRFTDRNDLSYGTYIYGWPVQQTLVWAGFAITPVSNSLATLAITLPIAFLSWTVVEKPALKLKDWFGGPAPVQARIPGSRLPKNQRIATAPAVATTRLPGKP